MVQSESHQSATFISAASTLLYLWLAVCICLIMIIPLPVLAQYAPSAAPGAIIIEPGGQLWIEGSASVANYICRAKELSGNGTIENTRHPRQNVQGRGNVSVNVKIPVHSLECGKRKMNSDMYEALKMEEHPYIRYKLLEAGGINAAGQAESEWMDIHTLGILEIAGVQDTAEVTIQGKLLSPRRFRVKGAKQLNMYEFDIIPPTALFGLIKADPALTVHFDVTVRLES